MPQLTRQFSICLIPDKRTEHDINTFRRQLPESPYRDDIPHLTLLRGVSSPNIPSDKDLVTDIDRLLKWNSNPPITGSVQAVENIDSLVYGSTSVLVIKPQSKLEALRANICQKLVATGYSIEKDELQQVRPQHITVRLGVPLSSEYFRHAESILLGKHIEFSKWLLFRLELDGNRRLMHKVWPEK